MIGQEFYYEHDYKKPWTTKIIETQKLEKGYALVLERTAFYPGGGGQPCDLGTIDGQELIEVYQREGKVYHLLADKPKNQQEVLCLIDQERRFDLMQQHTGQHLLSAVFFKMLNGQTSSFHLGLDYVTIDISIPDLSTKTITRIENQANQYIYQQLTIEHELMEQVELEKLPLRKQPKVEEDIRLVEIEGLDYSPCGGTHLDNTGQLGIVKIIKWENYKGNTRVYFKCGHRALKDYQEVSTVISTVSTQLSVSQDEIIERVEKELEKSKDLSKQFNACKEKTAYWQAKDIIANKKGTFIGDIFEEESFEEVENISKEILLLGNYTILFASKKDQKILFSHNGDSQLHCGKIFKEYLDQYQGRGGGNKIKAQAAFASLEDLESFYHFLYQQYKG